MKTKSLLASLLLIALALPAFAQTDTNAPPIQIPGISWDFLTNLPSAGTFDATKFDVSTGILLKSKGLENAIHFDFDYHTNWMFTAEIQNGITATVVDAFQLGLGYRIAWPNAEVYGQGIGRRTWTTDLGQRPSFQGGGAIGSTWRPMTGGRFMLGTEIRILTPEHGSVIRGSAILEPYVFTKFIF